MLFRPHQFSKPSTLPRRGFCSFGLLTSSLPLTNARRRIRSTLICLILATRTAGALAQLLHQQPPALNPSSSNWTAATASAAGVVGVDRAENSPLCE